VTKKIDRRFDRGKTLHAMKTRAQPQKPIPVVTPVAKFFQARWRWFRGLSKPKQIALIGGPILAFLILTPLITYLYFARDISDAERLMNHNSTGVVLQDMNGETFYSFGTADRGERLSLDKISDHVEQALISAEDKDFYNHGGFSVTSILGALYANFLAGDATAYGGSTLTQQLAKNTLLSDNQTILRKYQELSIAIAIEQNYSKDEILDMYLNSVYYGEGAFGIESAAKTYFGKKASQLNLAESAMLIGVLPAPSAYSPISGNPKYAKERQATVLGRMVDNGVITEAESEAAKKVKLRYAEQEDTAGAAPHFAEMILGELYEEYGEEQVTRSGYTVRTTLDLKTQRAANNAVNSHIAYIRQNGGSNASVVAIDPTTGQIRALVGSADYDDPNFGKVNMATSPRQPGSSIKPLYYAEAMSRGIITPATIIDDKPTDFGGYRPQNADRGYRGKISVRNALAQSLNIPAVTVMERLGVEQAKDALLRMGISTIDDDQDYGLSLALGSAETRLTDMTNAYAAFANEGQQFDQTMILSIEDKFDKEVYELSRQSSRQVMSEAASFLISDILNDEAARAPIFGGSLNTSGYDAAVKTGTTDSARDAWTIGYTKQLAVGVWVGNNNNTPMNSGGSSMAGPIWQSTLLGALSGTANEPFTAPSSIERLLVCRSNGYRAVGDGTKGTYQEYFMKGAVPSETCEVKVEPKDADKDGVIDEDDECADTPANTEVDAQGCPVEDETPLDTDGDGVPDLTDNCADTDEGAPVDANGCAVDTDNDGIPDTEDECPEDEENTCTPDEAVMRPQGSPVAILRRV
jgi:1A family penicillin-binding protein